MIESCPFPLLIKPNNRLVYFDTARVKNSQQNKKIIRNLP